MEASIGAVALVALVVFLAVVVPVLAILAFVRVQRLEHRSPGGLLGGDATEKLRALENRVLGLEKAVERLYNEFAGKPPAVASPAIIPPSVAPAPPVAPPRTIPAPMAAAPPSPPASPESSPPPLRAAISAPLSAPPAAPATASSSGGASDLESVVAGKWLNYVGIVALLFAVAFFIKLAFDNNWIGPRGRVGIGILAGALLVAWSDRLLRRGYRYFSEGIAGLGAAVLYVSLWGGWHYYKLFDSGAAFAAMIVVTAAMTVIALGRNSQRLAVLALIGGFLTPQLVSTGIDHEIVLFSYTAILSLGMLAMDRARQWRWLPPLAFVASEIYFWGWYNEFYAPEKLAKTLAFAVLFLVIFTLVPLQRGRKDGRVDEVAALIGVSNVAMFLLVLFNLYWPQSRWTLTFDFLALAAAHLLVLRVFPFAATNAAASRRGFSARWLFSVMALLCVSLAIPARLDHQWLTITWAIEGAILIGAGAQMDSWRLRATGLFFLLISALRLLILTIPAKRFLWNERFLAYAVAVACFAISCALVRRLARELSAGERNVFAALAVAVNVYALIALSLEIWDFFGRTRALGMENWLAQQVGLSILWTLYAGALIVLGLARRAALLRWQALALFGLVVVKVFTYDMSSLDRVYRILSFLVLGVLLLGVSFLYQRRLAARKSEGQP